MVCDTYHPRNVLLLLVKMKGYKKTIREHSLREVEALFFRKCKDSVVKNHTNHFASNGKY